MDELDLLLEELAQTSAKAPPVLTPPQTLTLNTSDIKGAKNGSALGQCSGAGSGEGGAKSAYSELSPVKGEVMSPGTASRELDSIMNELLGLGLEVDPAITPPLAERTRRWKPTQKNNTQDKTLYKKQLSKNVDAIDDLLGSLSSDMEKMGVRTAAKGHCSSCGKCIAGKVMLNTESGQNTQPH
ncbi:leupaxin [Hoplias malabaricus]|uniref:leupaxin n=1 Tax=Hoplias malabaricus TaxID=27720 RepID=UPI00346222D8